MKARRFAAQFGCSLAGALVLAGFSPSATLAQDHDRHMTASHTATDHGAKEAGERAGPDRPRRNRAIPECVGRPECGLWSPLWLRQRRGLRGDGTPLRELGAVADGKIEAAKPEIILYEPASNGRLRITGADYLVLAADWDQTHTSAPELNGQLFHYFEAPNRFGLPAFYTLHVWAWKDNPAGTFTNWNPDVSCDGFNGLSH